MGFWPNGQKPLMPGFHFLYDMKSTPLHALLFLSSQSSPSMDLLARHLGVSQQSASRWLAVLIREGLVHKIGGAYRITRTGQDYLSSLLPKSPTSIVGRVFSGLGEGRYYLSQKGYLDQFSSLLGFLPFPGTLNLRLTDELAIAANRTLRARPGKRLSGFVLKSRTFGGARCYSCAINGKITGAIIVPERAHYAEDVVEVLAPVYLREKLHLLDNSTVTLTLLKNE
jgi:riboflavin kinase, archaea type